MSASRHVCLVADGRENPVMAALVGRLRQQHHVDVLDMSAAPPRRTLPMADLFLLKSRTYAALELAAEVEDAGAIVMNSHSATAGCLDRVWAAARLAEAGIPAPRTASVPAMADVTPEVLTAMGFDFPFIVKSRRSRKGDLVAKVDSTITLKRLQKNWSREPVVIQEYLPNNGWDIKAWGIGDAVHLAGRRSPLTAPSGDQVIPADFATDCRAVAAMTGAVFGLELYGVDLVITRGGLAVIDVNAFPGFRSVPDADQRLAHLVSRTLRAEVA